MMIVYVTTQGAQVVREGRHLLVRKEDKVFHTLFTYKLEQLVLCGRIGLTAPVIQLLLQEDIDTVFLRRDGRYLGRLFNHESKNVFLRKQQFAQVDNTQFCLRQAKAILYGKLSNMLTVLQRLARERKQRNFVPAIQGVKDLRQKLNTAQTLATLRGYEGAAAAAYFSGLRLGFIRDLGFTRRIRRPPTDPVNAVLSLLYTFLINRLYAAIRLAGLDPAPGVLHALDYGRQALPLDLVEEFRAPLADALCLALFNLRILQTDDFEIHLLEPLDLPPQLVDDIERAIYESTGRMSNLDAEGLFDLPDQNLDRGDQPDPNGQQEQRLPVHLSSSAFQRVLTAFEKKMQTEFFHPRAEKRMTYAEALVFQARLWRQVINGELLDYVPLLLR